ncbi:hypothetical protein ACFL5Z_10835, partial [Planctomycetota bacterium]
MLFNRVNGKCEFLSVLLILTLPHSATHGTQKQTQRLAMPNRALAFEGLTDTFLNDLKGRIQTVILSKAEAYFAEGGTAYSQSRASLKKREMIVNYYDYQPCCASV